MRFGETLDEIQSYMEALLLSLETTFSAPMEEFVKREVSMLGDNMVTHMSCMMGLVDHMMVHALICVR